MNRSGDLSITTHSSLLFNSGEQLIPWTGNPTDGLSYKEAPNVWYIYTPAQHRQQKELSLVAAAEDGGNLGNVFNHNLNSCSGTPSASTPFNGGIVQVLYSKGCGCNQ